MASFSEQRGKSQLFKADLKDCCCAEHDPASAVTQMNIPLAKFVNVGTPPPPAAGGGCPPGRGMTWTPEGFLGTRGGCGADICCVEN